MKPQARVFKPIADLRSLSTAELRAYRERAESFSRAKEVAEADVALNERMIGSTSGLSAGCVQRIAETLVVYREVKGSNNIGGTLKIFRNRGAKHAIEHLVLMPQASDGFHILAESGRLDAAFEKVVDEFSKEFSSEAVAASRQRIAESSKNRT